MVKELNFDEESCKNNILIMYEALSILIPKHNPIKKMWPKYIFFINIVLFMLLNTYILL